MKTITLRDGEILMCRMIGNMRTVSNRMSKVVDTQVGDQPAWETDEIGVIGEYAFCKMNNIFFDCDIAPRSGSYDCMFKGYRVDVKTTKRPDGQLISRRKINSDVDVFVLAIVNGNEVKFPGYYPAKDFYQEENLTTLNNSNTPTFVVSQSKLKQWSDK